MTVTQLRSPAADVAWVARLSGIELVDPSTASDQGLRDSLRVIGQLESHLAGRKLALARELDRRQVAKNVGATSTGSLVAGDFGGNRSAGDRLIKAAKNLETASLTETALQAGEITFEQAEIVGRAV